MSEPIVVALIVLLALGFDFINGLHDAANSIATVVSTRVLSPRMAVIWAAFFNFIAFLVFHNAVAATIGKGVVRPTRRSPVARPRGRHRVERDHRWAGIRRRRPTRWWAVRGRRDVRGLEALVSGIVKIGAFILIALLWAC
jgi:hypothetical protein